MTALPDPVRELLADRTLVWHTDRVDPGLLDATPRGCLLGLPGVPTVRTVRAGRTGQTGWAGRRFAARRRTADELAVVVAADPVDLRDSLGRILADAPATPVSRVALVVLDGSPEVPVPDPEWPALRELRAVEVEGAAVTYLEFAAPLDPRRVWPRLAARPGTLPAWPVIGTATGDPARPPGDPLASVRPTIPARETDDLPPDVVLGRGLDPTRQEREPHHVLAAPTRWQVLDPDADGPLALGPVDDAIHRPVGFDRRVSGAPVPLVPAGDREGDQAARFGYRTPDQTVVPATVPPSAIAALRTVPGVRIGRDFWAGSSKGTAGAEGAEGAEGTSGLEQVRTLVRLAAAGIPVVVDELPDRYRRLLDPELAALWTPGPNAGSGGAGVVRGWETPLAREEYAIRLRRAALRGHGRRAWRARAATGATGSPDNSGNPGNPGNPGTDPTVSVVLPTRRPDQLEFALRQVARQRGAAVELVLAAHGFTPDPALLRAYPGDLQLVQAPASTPFGALLNQAWRRSGGDVVAKMDDDDWYGPDFLADALLALDYSGADVVGCAPEFTFLEPLWATVRRRDVSEAYRSPVAGGTLCIRRGLLAELGGFRPTRRYVDAALLAGVRAAGGSVYRFHGTGYVLRRTGEGHTWDPGMGYFVTRARTQQQWRGFAPSTLLAPDPRDLPSRPRRPGRPDRPGHPSGPEPQEDR